MGVFFKKEEYADPTKKDAAKMFYPRLVPWSVRRSWY